MITANKKKKSTKTNYDDDMIFFEWYKDFFDLQTSFILYHIYKYLIIKQLTTDTLNSGLLTLMAMRNSMI